MRAGSRDRQAGADDRLRSGSRALHRDRRAASALAAGGAGASAARGRGWWLRRTRWSAMRSLPLPHAAAGSGRRPSRARHGTRPSAGGKACRAWTSSAITAVVLAAGAGAGSVAASSLRPLAGRPVLQHVLDRLADAGVERGGRRARRRRRRRRGGGRLARRTAGPEPGSRSGPVELGPDRDRGPRRPTPMARSSCSATNPRCPGRG